MVFPANTGIQIPASTHLFPSITERFKFSTSRFDAK